jgi:large subunit ribosomal protein L6
MKRKPMLEEIELPQGVEVRIENHIVNVKGPKGEISRRLVHPLVEKSIEHNKIKLTTKRNTKREKKMVGTFKAHINNMIKGVTQGHFYKMKICSGHFPMTVSVVKQDFIVKNFFGERIPRKLKLKPDVDVKVEGDIITIQSLDKEAAGQTAGSIELLCKKKRGKFDKRIFQDGIFIINKDGKELK